MKFNMERYGGISIKYKGYNGDSNSVKEGKQDPNSSDSSRKTPLEPLRQDSDVN